MSTQPQQQPPTPAAGPAPHLGGRPAGGPMPGGRPPQTAAAVSWSWIFLVILCVANMPRTAPPASPDAAQRALVFRAVVTTVALVGFLVTLFFEQRAKARLKRQQQEAQRAASASPPPAHPAGAPPQTSPFPVGAGGNPWDLTAGTAAGAADPYAPTAVAAPASTVTALVVSYVMTATSAKRVERYVVLHNHVNQFNLLFTPVLVGGLSAMAALPRQGALGALVAGLKMFVIVAVGFGGFLLLLGVAMFKQRYPRPDSVRPGTMYLTAEGVYDYLPDKTVFLPWKMIRAVRSGEGGDLYFFPRIGAVDAGVPREAFRDEASARRFFEAAEALWRTKGALWPAPAVMEEFAPGRPLGPTPGAAAPPVAPPLADFDLGV